MDSNQLAKDIGGLAAILVLLAHFVVPGLPLTALRVQVLLFLIGALLVGDWMAELFTPPGFGPNRNRRDSETDDE